MRADKWRQFLAGKEYMKNVVIPAFSAIGLNQIVERLTQCGEYVNYIQCSDCGAKHYAGFSRCKNKFCVNCMRVKSHIWLVKILTKLYDILSDYDVFMLNLTVRDGPVLSDRIDFLEKSWRMLYHDNRKWSKNFKSRIKGGIRSLEVKKGKNSNEWHPHFHTIVVTKKGEYVKDYYWLRDAWKEITEDNGSVYIKGIGSDRQDIIKGVIEVIKYIIKPEKSIFENVMDLKEIYTVLNGKRQINTFGLLRTKDSDVDKEMDSIEEKKLAKFICQLCGSTSGYLKLDIYYKLRNDLLLDIKEYEW